MARRPRTSHGPEGPPDVSVVTTGHDVADARLHREVAALRRLGLQVEVLGLGDAADGPAGAQVLTRARSGLAGRALAALTVPWRARGRVLVTLDPDALAGAVPAARLRRRRLVADVHEDYAALLADRAWATGAAGRVGAQVAALATRLAGRADLTVVADEHVPPRQARNRLVLRNLPDLSMLPEPSAPGPVPRALYVGDVRRSRGAFAMVEAVRRAPGWHLDLVGPVAAADAEALDRLVASPELAGRVVLHGRQPPHRAWQLAAGAWAGLSLLEDTPAFRAAVPTKVYEYLACGLPVVASDLPATRTVLGEAGALLAPADGAAAGQVLRRWLAEPDELAAVRARAAAAGAAHRQEAPYAPFAEAVARLAGR